MSTNLVEIVKSAGIIGAGGAGFPTHVKIDAEVDTVIVNGAECEPLLRVDQQLMAERAHHMLVALQAVMDHTKACLLYTSIRQRTSAYKLERC